MFKSVLLAGFFWASANFMPLTPVVTPTAVANTVPTLSAPIAPAKAPVTLAALSAPLTPAPVQMASVSNLPKAHLGWEFPEQTPSPAPVSSDALSADEQEFISLINSERTSRGLNALTVDPLLVVTARAHSREMCDLNYFNHHSPTPGLISPMDRYLNELKETGGTTPDYLLVGENIFYCSIYNSVYNAEYGHRALMASPGHRANILDGRFTKIGLGVYHNSRGEFWVTQMFSKDSE